MVCTGFCLSAQEVFETLTVGAQTYTNVTVTTKTRTDVFITHAHGIASLKVQDVDYEALVKLGYESPKPLDALKSKFALPTSLHLQPTEVRAVADKLIADANERLKAVSPVVLAASCGGLLIFFLLYCYLCKLICLKAGHPPGFLIWLPLLQVIPLLRAARMSPIWILALFIPVLNLVAYLVWAVKISRARNKSLWPALGLCLPLFNLSAFLYLALSDGVPDDTGPKLMRFNQPDDRAAV